MSATEEGVELLGCIFVACDIEAVLEEPAGVLDGLAELISALCVWERVPVLSIHFTVLSRLISILL